MKRTCTILFALYMALSLMSASAVPTSNVSGFDRYQIIIDKSPFGTPPAVVTQAPVVAPVKTGPSWVESYRMTMLMEDNQGRPRVGLLQVKENKSFTLRPGQDIDGIVLKSVDYSEESAIIAKNGDEKTIKMQAVASTPPPAPKAISSRPTSTRSKYLARRAEQQKAAAKPVAVKPPKYTGEELEKHLRDYQMEVLRKGLPPLPVPLTPEMDNQLVGEGVLPPQEGQEGIAPPPSPGGLPAPGQ